MGGVILTRLGILTGGFDVSMYCLIRSLSLFLIKFFASSTSNTFTMDMTLCGRGKDEK